MGAGQISDLIDGDCSFTQAFGCTDYAFEWPAPNCAGGHMHTGIDLGAACGLPVKASRAGTVAAIGIVYLGDSAVGLHHDDDGLYSLYGHMVDAVVSVGQHVAAGEVIGHIGTKGASTGCHLHLEVRTDGPFQSLDNLVDPTPYLFTPSIQGGNDLGTLDGPQADELNQIFNNTDQLNRRLDDGFKQMLEQVYNQTQWTGNDVNAVKAELNVDALTAAITAKLGSLPAGQAVDVKAVATEVVAQISAKLVAGK